MRLRPLALLLALASVPSGAFIRSRTASGVFLRRPDFTSVPFVINERTAPGLTNSSGGTIITADSDPIEAIQAAMDAWTSVPTSNAAFAPPGRTAQESSANNGEHMITFVDTPSNRSIVGDALAVTRTFSSFGEVLDTDILFSPTRTFSTTLQPGTYDIQSVATHELGHALGSSHSGLISATMYFATRSASMAQRVLTADDIAFVTEAYPEAGIAANFGTIAGAVMLNGGGPVAGALVTAIDPSTGVAVGNLTNSDGIYTIPKVPPGRYIIYTEPMDGPVRPDQIGSAGSGANIAFRTAFYGGADSPNAVAVRAGETAAVDLTVESGDAPLNLEGAGSGSPTGSISLSSGPFLLGSGQTVGVAVYGKGLDDPGITEDSISFVGAPIAIQKGSLRRSTVTLGSGSTAPAIRFTVAVADNAPPGVASLLIRTTTAAALFSAGAKLLGAPPSFSAAGIVNAASFLGGSAVAGEIISIFGTGLGPAQGVTGLLDPINGKLSTRAAGVMVTFNGVPAPLFFVSQGQINTQVPFEMATESNASVAVSYQGVAGNSVNIPIGAAQPGIFMRGGSRQGVILNQDGVTLNGPSSPAPRGSVVVIFATGQGQILPPLATGELAPLQGPLSAVAQPVAVTIGGQPARLVFAGMTPNFVGLLQINAEVPADAPTGGNVPVTITIGGVSSQPDVSLAIR